MAGVYDSCMPCLSPFIYLIEDYQCTYQLGVWARFEMEERNDVEEVEDQKQWETTEKETETGEGNCDAFRDYCEH